MSGLRLTRNILAAATVFVLIFLSAVSALPGVIEFAMLQVVIAGGTSVLVCQIVGLVLEKRKL